MTRRNEHTFTFTAGQIAHAAGKEAGYHEERAAHWTGRRDAALTTVKSTIGAKVVEQEMSGGAIQANVVVDYGNPEAWREFQLAVSKIQSHKSDADRFRTAENLYSSQPNSREYVLDAADVHEFRLGGQPRPE